MKKKIIYFRMEKLKSNFPEKWSVIAAISTNEAKEGSKILIGEAKGV